MKRKAKRLKRVPNRLELIEKIIILANLPHGKKTPMNLTKAQLTVLETYLRRTESLIGKLVRGEATDDSK